MYFYKLYQKCYQKEREHPSARIADEKKDDRGAFRINVDHRYYTALKHRATGLEACNSGVPFYVGAFAFLAIAGATGNDLCAKASITCAVTAAMLSIYRAAYNGGVLGESIEVFHKAMERKGDRLYFLQCEREEAARLYPAEQFDAQTQECEQSEQHSEQLTDIEQVRY